MIASTIRKITSAIYHDKSGSAINKKCPSESGLFKKLKIALIADSFTSECLSMECDIKELTPQNYREILPSWRPDIFFVESAFHGSRGSWRYMIAKHSRLVQQFRDNTIIKVIDLAKKNGIPAVFWNKDDGALFDVFIDRAKHFDYIFTTDANSVKKYREYVNEEVKVNTLMMPYQHLFHNFSGFNFVINEANFVGSYYRMILPERKKWLDMIFDVSAKSELNVNIFDRNYNRLSRYISFRYPKMNHIKLLSPVSHHATAEVYKNYLISLNVNSVTGSPSMYSRRLLEIMACGGIVVTNPSQAIEKHFKNYCHIVQTSAEAYELFSRLKAGPSKEDFERAAAGAEYVRAFHTWQHRLEEICKIINI